MLKKKDGFTMIELAMVITILALLTIVAVARMVDMSPIRIDIATRKIQSDIRYAQALAISTQRWTGLYFSVASDNYSVYIDDSGVSPTNWALATNPLTKANYTVQLNSGEFEDVDITIAYFNGYNKGLVFDKWGNPYSYDIATGATIPLDNPTGIRLTNSSATKDTVVTRGTGQVYIQ